MADSRAKIRALLRSSLDVEDPVSLAEFAELRWSSTATRSGAGAQIPITASNRHSWMRTQNSRGRSRLPAPVLSPTHTTRYRLGDLISWVEAYGDRRVCVDDDWRWALKRGARAYLEAMASVDDRGDARSSAVDELRHFLLGLILLCAPKGSVSDLDPALVELVAAPPPSNSIPETLIAFAEHRESVGGALAARLLASLAPPPRPGATRCAQATLAALLDSEAPSALADSLFVELGDLSAGAGTTTTESALATLMCEIAHLAPDDTVVDPACGEGRLLLTAGRVQPHATLIGRDIDRGSLDAASALFRLNGLKGDLGLTEDSLQATGRFPRADVVLVDPPSLSNVHVRRWLTLAAAISPEGRIVIVLPASSLRPGRREWREVADRVIGVVACPAQSKTDTGDAPALWVLGGSAARESVLIIDASQGPGRRLASERVEDIGALFTAHSTGPEVRETHSALGVHIVARSRIDEMDGDLRPRTWSSFVAPAATGSLVDDPAHIPSQRPWTRGRNRSHSPNDEGSEQIGDDPVILSERLLHGLSGSRPQDEAPSELERALLAFLETNRRR